MFSNLSIICFAISNKPIFSEKNKGLASKYYKKCQAEISKNPSTSEKLSSNELTDLFLFQIIQPVISVFSKMYLWF